ncbi:MAG: hypothetical protein MJ204_02670 [Bacteroidales bacterium]|nr:hypothetical protein [Bacteroidales bacterium]MCQ2605431.1 hypothetical protein [Bacteroidales bacterium]
MNKKQIIKIAVYAIIAVVAIYVGYRIYVKVKDRIASNKQAKELDNSIDVKNLSYDIAQYQAFAKQLKSAMESSWYNPFSWGTAEEEIAKVFSQMQTRSDVLMLIKTFGVQNGETLNQWIDGDLSSEEKEKYVNEILKSKSINYVF